MRIVVYGCLALVLAASMASQPAVAEDAQQEPAKQQVVVHLTHFTDDLHRCFMALKLAGLMQKSGADVTLFLDLEGVRLAERRQKLDLTWGANSTPLSEHYQAFTDAGGKVLLCPHCAHAAHIGDMSLKRNSEIASEQVLGTMLLEADKILDY